VRRHARGPSRSLGPGECATGALRTIGPEDWSDPALNKRVDRAAVELVLLMESGFARKIRDASWESYQHEYGSGGGTEVGIDLDSDLMRLAAGGSAP
jgi:FMN reductase